MIVISPEMVVVTSSAGSLGSPRSTRSCFLIPPPLPLEALLAMNVLSVTNTTPGPSMPPPCVVLLLLNALYESTLIREPSV